MEFVRGQTALGLRRWMGWGKHRVSRVRRPWRRLHKGFTERHDGDFDGKATGLPDAALHFLNPLLKVRMAGGHIAPGIKDRDDRLPLPILGGEAHLLHARPMAKGTKIIRPKPAMAAEILGVFMGL